MQIQRRDDLDRARRCKAGVPDRLESDFCNFTDGCQSDNSQSGAGRWDVAGLWVGGGGGGLCGSQREVAFSRFDSTRGRVIQLGNRHMCADIQEVMSPAGWQHKKQWDVNEDPRRTDGRGWSSRWRTQAVRGHKLMRTERWWVDGLPQYWLARHGCQDAK